MRLEVDRYLGRVYVPGRYVCWDLARDGWLELTGQDIGDRPAGPADALAVWRLFRRLDRPASPSIVVMRHRRSVPHMGLFWRKRVLHIGPSGVRYDRLSDATAGFDQVGFYGCSTSS